MLRTHHLDVAQKVCSWAKSDIEDGCRIYNALVNAYGATLQVFGGDVSLFKVYFYDILKLLTQSHYKKKELEYGVQPENRDVLGHLGSWPYLGYADIANGFDFEQKKYGKHIAIDQSTAANLGYLLSRIRKVACPRTELSLLATSPTIDQRCNLWLDAPAFGTRLIAASNQWFALPELEQQIQLVSEQIQAVMDECAHPVSPKVVTALLSRHVSANTRSGRPNIKLDGDVIVLRSGIELRNRMLAAAAKMRGLKVINVMHGEAFGVYDEPHFSMLGETAYADGILGYGNAALSSKVPYRWGLGEATEYIGSNGVGVAKMYSPEYSGVQKTGSRLNYYYFPTALAGSSHRYGPFRDVPDSIYVEWQFELCRVFGDELTFKRHPKEKYGGGRVAAASKAANGTIEDLIDDIDVFVFDYIGTAFNVACATAKPIVYIDLGIRNIHPDALDAIKRRVIYFDLRDGLPSKKEIDARVRFGPQPNTYSQQYSLGGEGKRTHSLVAGLTRRGP